MPGNHLSNGNAESGLSPWVGRGGAQVALNTGVRRSGNNSILTTNRTAAWHGAAYPIEYLTPGNTYEFIVWVRLVAGQANTTAKLTIERSDAAGTSWPNVAQAAVNSNGWTQLRGTYTHSPVGNVTSLLVYVEAENATASYYVDDLSMTGTIAPRPQPVAGDITINIGTTYQLIDGFGAALPMWTANTWTEEETRRLVSMDNDSLGLSIVRTIIRPLPTDANGNLTGDRGLWNNHVSALQHAQRFGNRLQILASPWSPPARWKDNNSLNNGGKLLRSRYADYANYLNDYVVFMDARNVRTDVVSIQNEPNYYPDYESAEWSGEDFRVFLRDHGSRIRNTNLMIAETIGFQLGHTDPSLNDPLAREHIGYIGGHLYGPWNVNTHQPNAALARYALAEQHGKRVWMTEWNLHRADNVIVNGQEREPSSGNVSIWADPNNEAVWNETLDDVLSSVHYSMTANWSAYIWWWGRRYYSFIGENRSEAWLNTPSGEILKRGWAFSQFSRYVRPGYVRVAATKGGNVANRNGLLVTAYQGDDNKLVVVMVNREAGNLDNVTIGLPLVPRTASYSFTSRFSARANRAITLNGQRATLSIPARSVSTVVFEY